MSLYDCLTATVQVDGVIVGSVVEKSWKRRRTGTTEGLQRRHACLILQVKGCSLRAVISSQELCTVTPAAAESARSMLSAEVFSDPI